MPPDNASLRVQLFAVQVHPVPAMDTSVNPEGIVSVTVTAPLVGNAFAAFDTATVYVAPCWPCAKLPTCDLVMDKIGTAGVPVPVSDSDTTGFAGSLLATLNVAVAAPTTEG